MFDIIQQKVKSLIFSMIEGAFYGFLCGSFLWVILYSIYEAEMFLKNRTPGGFAINHNEFPFIYLDFSITLSIIGVATRFLVNLLKKVEKQSTSGWLITGLLTFKFLYFYTFLKEIYYSVKIIGEWFCCLADSTNFNLLVAMLLWIMIFSLFYSAARRCLSNYSKWRFITK